MARLSKMACGKMCFALLSFFFFFTFLFPHQRLHIANNMRIWTHLIPYRLYTNYRCYQITLQWNIFTQIGAVRSFGWIFIVGLTAWRWLGEYVTMDKTFHSLFLKRKTVAASSLCYCHIAFLIAFLDKGFVRNIIIIKVKVRCSRYRSGVTQRVGISIALLFLDQGTRRGWVVSSTPRPHFTAGKDPVPILQKAGWAPGTVWTDAELSASCSGHSLPRERPGTHCTGGWVGTRAGLDRCGKYRHHRDSIPGTSCP